MTKIGEVKAILDDKLLLIESEDLLSIGDYITVFTVIQLEDNADANIGQNILYPKGTLKIICSQDNNLYLAERYRHVEKKTKRITVPSAFHRSMMGFAAQLQPETKEIEEEIPGPWSAELNEEQSLNIQFSKVVAVGDPVGRLS